jgi:hypothetical protein
MFELANKITFFMIQQIVCILSCKKSLFTLAPKKYTGTKSIVCTNNAVVCCKYLTQVPMVLLSCLHRVWPNKQRTAEYTRQQYSIE